MKSFGIGLLLKNNRVFSSELPYPARRAFSARNNAASERRGTHRGRRRGLVLATGVVVLSAYCYDRQYKYSTLTRNLRAAWTFAVVAVDTQIQRLLGEYGDQKLLQERNADRFIKMFQANGGIYQKLGQTIALQSTTMSPEMRAKFAVFYDDCPSVGLSEIAEVLRVDFDLPSTTSSPEAVFDSLFLPGSFEGRPVGSASIAQVHKARLQDTGEAVAVKVQKPAIEQQLSWDLWVFSTMTRLFATHIPSSFRTSLTQFFTDRITLETDFINEVSNAEHLRESVLQEPSLRNVVHIPKTYSKLCTKRVMVAEWIDGVPISETELLTGSWKSNAVIGTPVISEKPSNSAEEQDTYGLGLPGKDVMSVMLDLFCAQTFLFGQVHCDPHPGNILIQRLPNGKPQLVLLDHGLYVSINPKLRRELALFWRSVLTFDRTTLLEVAEAWGFGNVETLSKVLTLENMQEARKGFMQAAGEIEPDEPSPNAEPSSDAKAATDGSKPPTLGSSTEPPSHSHNIDPNDFFLDPEKIPKELIFIARNFRIVQGNNRLLGTPIDRLKVIGRWAQASLKRDNGDGIGGGKKGVRGKVEGWWREGLFRVVLWGLGWVGWWEGFRERFRL